jgi:hypothetical protein
VLFVGPERPLRGAAGLADWRLCGALSRVIQGGLFEGKGGEVLLVPSAGRFPAPRIFCLGLPDGPPEDASFKAAAEQAVMVVEKARCRSFAAPLPPHREAAGESEGPARLWLGAARGFSGDFHVLVGDVRGLQKALAPAAEGLRIPLELDVPRIHLELPRADLPASARVVR